MKGFLTLVEREYYRFIRLAGQTIAPPVIMTGLFVVVFGYSLGGHIQEMAGVPYIVYILPGVAAMGVINNAFANTTTSIYMARMDRSIENILASPMSPFTIVLAFVIGGMTRGVIVGAITLGVASLLTELTVVHPIACFLWLVLLSLIFSAMGVIAALWAEDWDHLATLSTFFLTPMTYLGGVFYQANDLPPIWQKVTLMNPLHYFIDGLRWTVLGVSDAGYLVSWTVTGLFCVFSLLIAVVLFRRGYKLVV